MLDMPEDNSASRAGRRYRFGVFEVDAATGELRRQGMRVKLNAQPFQLLCMLLDRRGEVLAREEIARELWSDDTFVDFEHGVNSAINRIREALGDTASNPRFVETLARRGYRFVAPVERIGGEPARHTEPSESASTATQIRSQSGDESPADVPESDPSPHSRILSTPEELPNVSHPVVQTIFVLFQLMYLGFYVGALANLAEIDGLMNPLPHATLIFDVLVATAAVLIPVRAFILTAAVFRAPAFHKNFLMLWPFLLLVDVLWSLSPFLLLHHINAGLALACTTLLVYSPFAQRSLILMGAGSARRESIAAAR
jgi:DNA-binding winged helix-turn-helix (wHTH) protein